MSEKRPKINVEMNPAQYYPHVREELKKELERQFPNEPETVTEQLRLADNLHMLEQEMEKIKASVDQRMIAAENNALTFLEASPERIPLHIKRLATFYELWKCENG
ncbi:hypothetical protein UAY_00141 [Enterococcus moraviensis ATCC BAA-383]|uniref:Uncharacterized protein n=1 Tax=Enterococcus moraviensis ATCC BAA-383 TaxID=1158609 RepID=R2TNL8_9ENTE|nr:hypothetical protein [Enterococcus moraviensis]EOI06799.1 hypothetical protein UAY_00141 [Enterococcus moraviensis ATCC BAA-383]EOT65136.1 hypothetical protein I586_02870 [Enterococcus moraviensis ATCC BAA-383]